MRRIGHWTPRYLVNRARLALRQRRHPDEPWLTAEAVGLLGTLLRPEDQGLEYGAGRSTIWLGQRTRSLLSLETSPEWFAHVRAHITPNVDLRLVAEEPREIYVEADPKLKPLTLDYVLVDGAHRDACALRAVSLLRVGGVLIVDNANWYLPCQSHAPNSASVPATSLWAEFLSRVSAWRMIWTSNGVTDTALWIKTESDQSTFAS